MDGDINRLELLKENILALFENVESDSVNQLKEKFQTLNAEIPLFFEEYGRDKTSEEPVFQEEEKGNKMSSTTAPTLFSLYQSKIRGETTGKVEFRGADRRREEREGEKESAETLPDNKGSWKSFYVKKLQERQSVKPRTVRIICFKI